MRKRNTKVDSLLCDWSGAVYLENYITPEPLFLNVYLRFGFINGMYMVSAMEKLPTADLLL